jgi:hypothetical protein
MVLIHREVMVRAQYSRTIQTMKLQLTKKADHEQIHLRRSIRGRNSATHASPDLSHSKILPYITR